MKAEDIIVSLIENAHIIYELYNKIRKAKTKEERKNFLSLIKYAIENEEKYLNSLCQYHVNRLQEIYLSFRGIYAFYECKIIENYIECSDETIPLLRILEKINTLIDERCLPVPEIDEDGELLYKEGYDIGKNKMSSGYTSCTEHIIDSIYPDLEIESCVRFMNMASSFEKTVKQDDLLKKLKQIPYDMTFLNPALEELFLKDKILNPSHELFDASILNEDCFEPKIFKEALEEDNSMQMIKQIRELASPRKTRTLKTAMMRSIYISFLYDTLSEDALDDVLSTTNEEIESIEYPFEIVNRLKECLFTRICYEVEEAIEPVANKTFQMSPKKNKKNKK